MQLAEALGSGPAGWNLEILVALLLLATFTAVVVKWVRLPYSIALVIAGLVVGVCHLLPPIEMTPDLVLVIMLPALLFEAARGLRVADLKTSWLPISALATIGVVISTLIVAAFFYFLTGIGLAAALLFGAMISATDPISVIALFKKLGLSKRLTIILEGESLFNDGTAVVLFKLILISALASTRVSITGAATAFTFMVLGGSVLGLALGFVASKLAGRLDDHHLEVSLTAILAYGSYLLAEAIHVSPVMSTICAGIVIGNYASKSMPVLTKQALDLFWEYAAFVVNSVVFLLIGLQMKLGLLMSHSGLIGVGILAILIARAVVVYCLSAIVSPSRSALPMSWRHVLFWGALRGSLCMALALSLPAGLPQREQLIVLTFGVVLFTLIVNGLTIEPMVRLLKIEPDPPEH